MDNSEFYTQLLDLHAPWQVLDVTIDQPSKRVDIHLGFGEAIKKGLLGFSRVKDMFGSAGQPICPQCHSVLPKNDELQTISVRHLPVAGFAMYLHVPAPGTVKSNQSDCICMRSWVATGTRCTVAMRSHVVALVQAASSSQAVLRLAGITADELHEIVESTKMASTAVAKNKDALRHADSIEDSNIPPVDHPHWQYLITGKLSIQTNSVPLRMLLQHVRLNYKKSPGSEAGIAGAKSLRQFFTRNQKSLKQEIDELNNNRPSMDIEAAGIKHTGRLSQEIAQPTDNSAASAGPARKAIHADGLSLPAERDPVWSRLISGEIELQSNAVSLQLLLGRVRQKIAVNDTEAQGINGAQILRNYFVRNQQRHADDIRLLISEKK